ncbi:hypothetical protein J2S16_001942 [Cytobacillus kochii]|nr:hypothetical protein [Cytobacillus kochii]
MVKTKRREGVNLLHWMILFIIVSGFITVASMKKRMENKLARLVAQGENGAYKRNRDMQVIIYWILGTVAWGVVSIFLIIWSFNDFFE